MHIWEKWIKRPQTVWVRKVLFQIHLWTGIALGLYVFVVCVSGSLAVFNSELYSAFLPPPKMVEITGAPLSRAELRAAAQRAHPRAAITRINIWPDPHEAAVVSLGVPTYSDQRFIDPYTGKDLGTARPIGLRMVSFFSQVHMNLLMGYGGRLMNGVGGFLASILSITGMVIWWPGVRRWRGSLTVGWNRNFKRLNWDLHSAIGFWTFAIILMWAITGAYLVFPRPFDTAMALIPYGRLIDFRVIAHPIHVGDFAGWPIKALWVILGFAPPVLFVTGSIMWWHRVLNPWRKRAFVTRPQPSGLAVSQLLEGSALNSERYGI
ncbi:MAG TPA: PepSY-associated TM helix domain-containing protein [Candidatus Acidoferrales bacterium]|jgi:uncharacterized iron-regulated membrane protein|nr:PepSY-associated TM helix domain-containing protein [Candidatus Acidoferrales bacterium]